MFNNFNLTDGEVLDIITTYENLITNASLVKGILNQELKEEIIVYIYLSLTRNRTKKENSKKTNQNSKMKTLYNEGGIK